MSFLADYWLDILVAIVLIISIWHGWRTGFLVGIFNLLSIPLGIAAAYFFAKPLSDGTGISLTYMYAIIFFAVVIGVHIVGSMLRKVLKSKVWIAAQTDALLGAIVGGAKAWILLVLFLVVWGGLLNSSIVQAGACKGSTLGGQISGLSSDVTTLGNDYNTAVQNSLFAHLNSFIVPDHVNAQSACGK